MAVENPIRAVLVIEGNKIVKERLVNGESSSSIPGMPTAGASTQDLRTTLRVRYSGGGLHLRDVHS